MRKSSSALTVLAAGACVAVAGHGWATPSPGSGSGSAAIVLRAAGVSGAAAPATPAKNGNTDPATGCNEHGECNGLPKDFGVTVGTVTGLYPGAQTRLPVTYTNPYSFAISVTTATVSAKGTQTCPATYLVTGTYPASPGLDVPRNGTLSTTLPIGLSPAAPDACKDARWTVTVSAQAVKS